MWWAGAPAIAMPLANRDVHCHLTGSPKWKFPPSNAPAGFGLVLIFIALAAAVPRLLLGASQFIEYDGYWHVFIAQQDNWSRFWEDIKTNAHPPLFFLLLKLALHAGHTLLVYRSISLATGIISVFLVGWTARKVTGSNILAYQTALAYGLALPGIIISCEVRSYMLSAFFVLLSFQCLLEIPVRENAPGEGRARAGFALGAILACLSHYYAFFYSGAAMALLLGRYVLRRHRGEIANWRSEAATILPVAAAIYTLYRVHVRHWAGIQGHLLPYYFDKHGQETAGAFLLRNWKNFVNLFSPWQISGDAAAFGVLAFSLVGALLSAALLRRANLESSAAVRAFWTILITVTMLVEIVLAALAGKYPFGGDLRQQYLLFPFLVLSIAIFVGLIAGKLEGLVPLYGRWLLNGVLIAAIAWVSVLRFEQYPKVTRDVAADRIAVFDRLEPRPAAVYVDQYNLITFFIYHHTWNWSSARLPRPIPGIDAYQLRRGPERMLVFRDKTQWNFEPDDSAVYGKLAECLRAEKIPDVSIFSARQTPPKPPFPDVKLVRSTVVTMASDAAVCVDRMTVNPLGWYATFRRSKCAPQDVQPVRATLHTPQSVVDDSSAAVQYVGLWSHGSFPGAEGLTESYSKDPGSVARLSFEGNEITYVYSKAPNRGIAEVKVDGVGRGEIDLYSRKPVWQARAAFSHLLPGKHTFELVVAGRKEPAAGDRYVALDALIVH
jgi:hypothetical protein